MAEGLAQKWLDEHQCDNWLAISAGVFALDGMPTSEETLVTLAQRDIAFEGSSTPFTKEMAQSAFIVFCMSNSHLAVAKQFTEHAELLDQEGDIADPIGQDQSVYDALAMHMEPLIARRLESLTHQGA